MKRGLPLILLFTSLGLVYLFLNWKYGIFNLPFFWDELGVYSRAAIHQAVHGLGLLPNSMPDVLSRGHPLLTPFVFGLSFKIFGISLVTARLTGIFIYFIGVYFAYATVSKFTQSTWAALIVFVFACQPAFLAQSILILPEILLLTTTLAAVYFFAADRIFGVVISLTLAVMVKESALVLPFAFGLGYLLVGDKRIKSTFLVMIPILVFLAFLGIQKIQSGYFLYPLHQGLIDFSIVTIYRKILLNLHFIFIDQGRYILFSIFIISIVIKLIKGNRIQLPKTSFTVVLLAIATGGIAFACINYYLDRYTLYFAFPFLLFIGIWAFYQPIVIKTMIVVGSLIGSYFFLNNESQFKDTDFAYTNHVNCIESTFTYVQTLPKDSRIGYNWPVVMAFWSNESGYHLPTQKADEVALDNFEQFDYLVISEQGNNLFFENAPTSIQPIKQIEDGYAKCTVYKVLK